MTADTQFTAINLNRIAIKGDALVYLDPIPNCNSWIEDTRGNRFPLLGDVDGYLGEVIKKLLIERKRLKGKKP